MSFSITIRKFFGGENSLLLTVPEASKHIRGHTEKLQGERENLGVEFCFYWVEGGVEVAF